MTSRVSKSAAPGGSPLHACTSARGACSWARIATWVACSSSSQAAISRSSSTRTRTGTVVMNSPTIDSTPASSAGRPDTVIPKTTSALPVYRLSSNPHAPCRIVLTVR